MDLTGMEFNMKVANWLDRLNVTSRATSILFLTCWNSGVAPAVYLASNYLTLAFETVSIVVNKEFASFRRFYYK